jgi:serine/threonine protein kinase
MSTLCKTCGKPPLANRAGSVTSYFFQHNYCQCESEKSSVEQKRSSKIASAKADDQVCANCGKSRPSNRRAGSFTAFLFKELRCSCAGAASKVADSRGAAAAAGSSGPARVRSRTAARIAQRKNFTESLRKSKAGENLKVGMAFQPGAVIGGAFRIESVIGQGGMGVVYLAEQVSLKKQLALKILAPELVNEQSWLRFKAEAKTLAALNHSSLVKVYDLGVHENTIPYYSMDFLQGQSLEEILANDGPLPFRQALPIFIEVLDGLAYAHRNGIVHRDLKPGNIMLCTVDGAESIKILDFGISKLIGPNAASSQSLTTVGEIFGSPFYMSPEQCSGSAVDARSDIYSLGCALIEVLTGFVPFEGKEFIETVMMHQEEAPPLLADLEPGLKYPPALDRVLAKCLAKRPQDRYQSAKEMALDLGRVLEGKEVMAPELASLSPDRSAHSAESSDRSFQLPLALTLSAAGVAAVLVAGSAYFILRPTSTAHHSQPLVSAADNEISPGGIDTNAAAADSDTDLGTIDPDVGSQVFKKASSISSEVESPLGKPPSSSDYAVLRKVATASRNGEQTAGSMLFETVPDIDGSTLEPKGSEKETFKYSTIVVENGRRLRRFNFPADTIIGMVRDGRKSESKSATGFVDFPADAPITFSAAGIVRSYPQYMRRFRSDDIRHLVLSLNACTDQVLSAAASLSGVNDLGLSGAVELTDSGFQAVGNFKHLDRFSLSSSNLTGEAIARANCWQNLTHLTWRNAKQPGAFLKKLQSSSSFTYLDLSGNKLSQADFELISKLTGLEHLSLAHTKVTLEGLEAIAALPKLTGLDLTNSGLGIKAIPVLQKMKNLKQLAILQATSSPQLRTALINQLPHVKIYGWSESMRVLLDD